ncbi:MAG: YihY/virulence factor BrkB family protein [Pseudomonadota bacterium]
MECIRFCWQVARNAAARWVKCNAFSYAGSLAFYTLFSLAPTMIIAVTVIGVVLGEEAAQGQLVAQLQEMLGHEAALAIEQTVSASRIEESGLLPSILGGGALLVGATAVFAQLQFSLNTLWGVTARPSSNSLLIFLRKRLLSLVVVLSIGLILLITLVLGVVVRTVLQLAGELIPYTGWLTQGAEFLLAVATATLLFATVFKILPDVVLGWRDVAVSAFVTALLFTIGRSLFATYLAYTATASAYGAAGSVVVVLLWVYYSSLILLFGAALTRSHLVVSGRAIVPRNSAVVVHHEMREG